MEAFIRGNLKVLEDWCHERAFGMLSAVVKEYQTSMFSTADSRIIDISKVEMVSGKMMDQGPVIVITFQVFMINVLKNTEGKVIQGDPVSFVIQIYTVLQSYILEQTGPCSSCLGNGKSYNNYLIYLP